MYIYKYIHSLPILLLDHRVKMKLMLSLCTVVGYAMMVSGRVVRTSGGKPTVALPAAVQKQKPVVPASPSNPQSGPAFPTQSRL